MINLYESKSFELSKIAFGVELANNTYTSNDSELNSDFFHIIKYFFNISI